MKLRTPFAATVAANSLISHGPADMHRGSGSPLATTKATGRQERAAVSAGSSSAMVLVSIGLFGQKGAVFQKFDEMGSGAARVATTDNEHAACEIEDGTDAHGTSQLRD